MSIVMELINLSVDEGSQVAIDEAQKLQSSLETLMEIGDGDERKQAANLLLRVNRTIEILLENTLPQIGRELGTDSIEFLDAVYDRVNFR